MEREAGKVIQVKGTTLQTQRNVEMQNMFRDRQEVQNSYMDPIWRKKEDEAEARLQRFLYTLQRHSIGDEEL